MSDHNPVKPFEEMTNEELRIEYRTRRRAYQRHVADANLWQASAMEVMVELSNVMRKTGVLP